MKQYPGIPFCIGILATIGYFHISWTHELKKDMEKTVEQEIARRFDAEYDHLIANLEGQASALVHREASKIRMDWNLDIEAILAEVDNDVPVFSTLHTPKSVYWKSKEGFDVKYRSRNPFPSFSNDITDGDWAFNFMISDNFGQGSVHRLIIHKYDKDGRELPMIDLYDDNCTGVPQTFNFHDKVNNSKVSIRQHEMTFSSNDVDAVTAQQLVKEAKAIYFQFLQQYEIPKLIDEYQRKINIETPLHSLQP
jgi:hypothetical protein